MSTMYPHGIMFHHFHAEGEKPYGQGSLNPSDLRQLIEFVGRERILDAKEFLERAQNGTLLPSHVCFTMDDNLLCQYKVALPVLREYGIKAFLFVNTGPFEGEPEMLESYKFFQGQAYDRIEDFYECFFETAKADPDVGSAVAAALDSEESVQYLSHLSFYTKIDRRFRFIRDVTLTRDQFTRLVRLLMSNCGWNTKKLLNSVWMSEEQLRDAASQGHIIGMHSHTHNNTFNKLDREQQLKEYSQCSKILADIVGYVPTAMAHPLGRYNEHTSDVLMEVGVKLGFLASMLETGSNQVVSGPRRFFMPRMDHSEVVRLMRGGACVKYGYPRAGLPLYPGSQLFWYDRSSHEVVKRAIEGGFGQGHIVSKDRSLFDWQYRGGRFVCYSTAPLSVFGHIPCMVDNPKLGTHFGLQHAMWWAEPSPDRAQIAVDAVTIPLHAVGEETPWSSFVLGSSRDAGLPFLRSLDFQVMDPVPRYLLKLTAKATKDEELSLMPWLDPDAEELGAFWDALQAKDTKIAVHRDAQHWKWRYIDAPHGPDGMFKYNFFRLSDMPLHKSGLIVARVQSHGLRIIEMLPPQWANTEAPAFKNLLDGVLAWGRMNGCDIVDFWCTLPVMGSFLTKHGWCNQFNENTQEDLSSTPMIFSKDNKSGRTLSPINIAFLSGKGNVKFKSQPQDWYFVKSDGDMDRPPGTELISQPTKSSSHSKKINKKVMLLGNSNLDWFQLGLQRSLNKLGVVVDVCGFGERAALLSASGSSLHVDPPDWIVLVDRPEDLVRSSVYDSNDNLSAFSDAVHAYATQIETFRRKHPEVAMIVLRLWETRMGVVVQPAAAAIIRDFNARMQDLVSSSVSSNQPLLVVDPSVALGFLPKKQGEQVVDNTMWVAGKYPYSLSFTSALCQVFAHYVEAGCGSAPRLLILDLDNTLWGGVLGEVGVEGIRVGARGEDYNELQWFIRALRMDAGMMLALVSKNDRSLVETAFEFYADEMPLRLSDFVAIYANWKPKSENVAAIIQAVNLSPTSVLMVDDNAAELSEVEQAISGIRVVAADHSDPLLTLQRLREAVGLTTLVITKADLKRTEQVRGQVQALESRESFASDIFSFFASVQSKVDMLALAPNNCQRVEQLIVKTNQFNLNGERLSLARLQKDKCAVYAVRHVDRFSAAPEVIGVVALHVNDVSSLTTVRLWAMSCRALGKGVELIVLQWIVHWAEKQDCKNVAFSYVETARNKPMYEFLEKHIGDKSDDGRPYLDLGTPTSQTLASFDHVITTVENEGRPMSDMFAMVSETKNDLTDQIQDAHGVKSEESGHKTKKMGGPPKEVVDQVWKIALDVSGAPDDVEPNKRSFYSIPGWSSLTHMQLLGKLREEMDVDICLKDIAATSTWEGLIRLIGLSFAEPSLEDEASPGVQEPKQQEQMPLENWEKQNSSTPQNTNSVTFSEAKQIEFAKLACDWNPIHMDEVAARRTLMGRVVVHGVHTLLWALDSIWESCPVLCGGISELRAIFSHAVHVGDTLTVTIRSQKNGKVTFVAETRGKAALQGMVVCGNEFSDNAQLEIPSHSIPKKKPLELMFRDVAIANGEVELAVDPVASASLFPTLTAHLPLVQMAELLATTRIVGMHCPGLHSIFAGLHLKSQIGQEGCPKMAYSVKDANEQLSMVPLLVKSSTLEGRLDTFFRPPPRASLDFARVTQHVHADEFCGQRALVVGGTRGLGEATVLCIAAGGGDVCYTYHQDVNSAENVAKNLSQAKCHSNMFQFDCRKPGDLKKQWPVNWTPNHLYYFATPFINIDKTDLFSLEEFTNLCSFYVTGLLETIKAVRQLIPNEHEFSVFVPSTTFLNEYQEGSAAYCAAKAAMEEMCRHVTKSMGIRVISRRLPRVDTDQTASLVQETLNDRLLVMLNILREII